MCSPSASITPSPCWRKRRPKVSSRRGPEALKELGNDGDGNAIKVLKGRYGPYVSDGDTNATIPEGMEPTEVSLEQALAMIADRAAKSRQEAQEKTGGKKEKRESGKD